MSIIIFGGIVARAPQNLFKLLQSSTQPLWNIILFVVITLISVAVIIYIQEGVRRVRADAVSVCAVASSTAVRARTSR